MKKWLFLPLVAFLATGCFKTHKPPVVTPPTPKQVAVAFIAHEGDQPIADASVELEGVDTRKTNADGYVVFPVVQPGPRRVSIAKDGFKPFAENIEVPKTNKDFHFVLERLIKIRRGVVRGEGRNWVDDDGAFYPLGESLFWAVRGWKLEPGRVRDNLALARKHKFDYIRILGEVGWNGNEIDPRWEDYEKVLASLIDAAYDEYGLRVEICLVGSGTNADYMQLAQKVANVVAPRPQKVLGLEVSNENLIKNDDLQLRILRYLKDALPNVVAATDAEHYNVTIREGQDKELEAVKAALNGGATYVTLHLERTRLVEREWRHVRQSWPFKDLDVLMNHDEPGGPLSSVVPFNEPIHVVMSRAVGLLNGVHAYTLHNGAGIYGQPNFNAGGGQRPANLWEVKDIDLIMERLRWLDEILPPRIGDGTQYRCCDQRQHPLVATNIWTAEGHSSDFGAVRDYAVDMGDTFVAMPIGIKDYVELVSRQNCEIKIYDPIAGLVSTRTLSAGERLRLEPHTRDSNGWGAYIIVGTYR